MYGSPTNTLGFGLGAASIFTGVLGHIAIWIRHEWDGLIDWIMVGLLVSNLTAFSFLQLWCGLPFATATKLLFQFELCHSIGLTCSIATYRLCFHRLRGFPGPTNSKISVWGRAWSVYRSGERASLLNHQLHQKYGDVVRIGPNQVSIRLASSTPLIHGIGRRTVCRKSVAYVNPVNPDSVNAHRDLSSHYDHRKRWDEALSPNGEQFSIDDGLGADWKAILTYLPKLCECINSFTTRLERYKGQPVSANGELSLFAFDVVGSVGFGRSNGFDSMTSGTHHPVLKELISMIRIGVYMMLIPWLHVLSGSVPTLGVIRKPDVTFRRFIESMVCEKYAALPGAGKAQDMLAGVMAPADDGTCLSKHEAVSDAVILTLAGADTTLSSMTHMAFRLARHPRIQEVLQQELQLVLSQAVDAQDWPAISKLPYLDAFIRETLRLHPPTPASLPRTTPPDGLFLGDGNYVPGNVDVISPIYSLQRDSRYFIDPECFIPERWISTNAMTKVAAGYTPRPGLIIDRMAYMPFLRGPFRCPGTQFAYAEMKMWLASMVIKFRVGFPENGDIADIDYRMNHEWKDYAMAQAAPIALRFLERR